MMPSSTWSATAGRDQGELVRLAIADLQVVGACGIVTRRNVNADHQLVRSQRMFEVRGLCRRPIQLREWDAALTGAAANTEGRVQGDECYREV